MAKPCWLDANLPGGTARRLAEAGPYAVVAAMEAG